MNNPLTIFSDLSERLHYNISDFPIYTKEDELKRYGYAALCHWHPDLEFIYIKNGIMDYFINGEVVKLEQNHAIFVNSRRLHYILLEPEIDWQAEIIQRIQDINTYRLMTT